MKKLLMTAHACVWASLIGTAWQTRTLCGCFRTDASSAIKPAPAQTRKAEVQLAQATDADPAKCSSWRKQVRAA